MLRVFLLLFFMLRPRCLPAIERGPVAAQPGAEASGAATDGPGERWNPPGVLCQGFAKAPLVVHPRASDARTRTALSLGESASSHFAVTAPLTLPSPPPLFLPLSPAADNVGGYEKSWGSSFMRWLNLAHPCSSGMAGRHEVLYRTVGGVGTVFAVNNWDHLVRPGTQNVDMIVVECECAVLDP